MQQTRVLGAERLAYDWSQSRDDVLGGAVRPFPVQPQRRGALRAGLAKLIAS